MIRGERVRRADVDRADVDRADARFGDQLRNSGVYRGGAGALCESFGIGAGTGAHS